MEALDSRDVSRPGTPHRRRPRRRAVAPVGLAGLAGLLAAAAPTAVAAHQLTGRFTSPIPLGAYLVGAGLAVGASFAIVFLRGGAAAATGERVIRVPPALRTGLAGIGLLAWLWVVIQAVVIGGGSEGDTASLFLWTYGWVGLTLVAAFVGPAWAWLDPFASLHRLLATAAGRFGLVGGGPAPYPARLGRWPAVLGFTVFIWLELAMPGARSGRGLGLVLVAYTVVTLVAMAQFGRETWRRNGEVFSVWFGLVGRLAPLAVLRDADRTAEPVGRPERLRVRRFATGLLEPGTDLASLTLVALSTAAILFDGLSQTQVYFDLFGIPTLPEQTVLLLGWLAIVVSLALAVGRIVGTGPLVAGLVPITIGYLIAHYLTFVLFDSQRIVLSLTDPLGLGWDLLGIGEFEPATGWLPGSVAWSLQLVAVVGGHVIGAWAGHAVALVTAAGRDGRVSDAQVGAVRRRQIPLALLMVGLTTLTLWSLGQAVVQAPDTTATVAGRAAAGGAIGLSR
jgi:hypothetical protein